MLQHGPGSAWKVAGAPLSGPVIVIQAGPLTTVQAHPLPFGVTFTLPVAAAALNDAAVEEIV